MIGHFILSSPLSYQEPPARCVWGTEEARTAQETLHYHGYGFAVHRAVYGITPFFTRFRGGENRIRPRLERLSAFRSTTQKKKGPTYALGS